jgi:hypothetical protein
MWKAYRQDDPGDDENASDQDGADLQDPAKLPGTGRAIAALP